MSSGDESTHFDFLVVGGGSGGAAVFSFLYISFKLSLMKFRSSICEESGRIWQESRSDRKVCNGRNLRQRRLRAEKVLSYIVSEKDTYLQSFLFQSNVQCRDSQ